VKVWGGVFSVKGGTGGGNKGGGKRETSKPNTSFRVMGKKVLWFK